MKKLLILPIAFLAYSDTMQADDGYVMNQTSDPLSVFTKEKTSEETSPGIYATHHINHTYNLPAKYKAIKFSWGDGEVFNITDNNSKKELPLGKDLKDSQGKTPTRSKNFIAYSSYQEYLAVTINSNGELQSQWTTIPSLMYLTNNASNSAVVSFFDNDGVALNASSSSPFSTDFDQGSTDTALSTGKKLCLPIGATVVSIATALGASAQTVVNKAPISAGKSYAINCVNNNWSVDAQIG